jgi:hypothetical protein
MSTWSNSSRGMKAEGLRVKAEEHPDWVSGTHRLPALGEDVMCTGGLAQVTRILGKTGDGSRLLELRLHEGKQPPFFVAASNVLVPPLT